MKAKVERLINRLTELRDQAHDDEFVDELDSALIHLEAASDRLIAMEEEEEDDLDPVEREAAIDLADQLIACCCEDLERCGPDDTPLDRDAAQSFVDRIHPTLG